MDSVIWEAHSPASVPQGSVTLGWQGVFWVLAAVALLTSVAAAFFLVDQLRPARSAKPVSVKGDLGFEFSDNI